MSTVLGLHVLVAVCHAPHSETRLSCFPAKKRTWLKEWYSVAKLFFIFFF